MTQTAEPKVYILKERQPEEPGVLLDRSDDLYRLTLDGKPDDSESLRRIADDRCPLCNNTRRHEIDRELLSGATSHSILTSYFRFGVTEQDVARHMQRHLLPLVGGLLHAGLAEVLPSLPEPGEWDEVSQPQSVEVKTDGELLRKENRRPSQLVPRALMGVTPAEPNQYAWDGGKRTSYIRWTRGRMVNEIEERAGDTMNYLDEMVSLRSMAKKIYDEVMEAGEIKNYGIAVSAIKEMRGVMDSIGRMGLIAKKLGESSSGIKRLSPEMQGMMAKLGIMADGAEPVSPLLARKADALDVAREVSEADRIADAVFEPRDTDDDVLYDELDDLDE